MLARCWAGVSVSTNTAVRLADQTEVVPFAACRLPVTYHHTVDIWDVLLGSATAHDPAAQWKSLLELTVPRAMYYFSGGLPLPPG